jgi:short-subunit dehydrogenase
LITEQKNTKRIAIVTGASSGLGRAYAQKIAQTSLAEELWLLGRSKKALGETALLLGLPSKCFAFGLEDREARLSFLSQLGAEAPNITLLVNNAGFGLRGLFSATNWRANQELLQVNIEALVHLTQCCLPWMKAGSHIIQVSSIAALTPLRAMNLYSASKAFILSFGLALRQELKPKGIAVQVLCPGPVETGFAQRAAQGTPYRSFQKRISPELVVNKSLRALRSSRAVVYGTLGWWLLSKLLPLFPKTFLTWLLSVFSGPNKKAPK